MKQKTTVESSLFIKAVGDCIRNKILEFFIEGREFDYPIKYLAEEIGINRNTLYKAIDELISNNLIIFSRRIGSSKFYKLNLSDPIALDFVNLFKKIINMKMMEYIKEKGQIMDYKGLIPESEFKGECEYIFNYKNSDKAIEEMKQIAVTIA